MKVSTASTSSFPTLLTLVFLVLKVTHVVSWSWWIVFLPLLIVLGVGPVILVLAVFFWSRSSDNHPTSFRWAN